MSKHTKGPWNWTSETNEHGKLTGKQIIYDNDEKLGYRYRDIAHLPVCKNRAEVRANAKLIAAAPDMLDGLKAILKRCKAINTKEPKAIAELTEIEEYLNLLIEKATK